MGHDVVIDIPPETLSYETVVQRLTGHVYRVALGVVRDPGLAEDASQEAFLALLQHVSTFANESALRGWLGRVGFNAALRILRTRKRQRRREETVEARKTKEAHAMTHAEDSDRLWTLVDGLPLELRAPIRLKYLQDVPQHEIAEVLGCSTGTVSNRLRQGIDRLRARAAQAGLAGIVPMLETRLTQLAPEPVPSSLVSRLLELETSAAAAAAVAVTGGSATLTTKLLVSCAAIVAAALGVGFAASHLASDDPQPDAARVLLSETDLANVGAPILEGRTPPEPPAEAAAEPASPTSTSTAATAAALRASLRGIVRLPDGTPAEGADVRVKTPIKVRPAVSRKIRTNADGTWAVHDLPPSRGWVVAVRRDGAAPWRATVPGAKAEEGRIVETDLRASWSIRGVLRGADGEPVTGTVPLVMATGGTSGRSQLPVDAEGRFEIRDLDPEKHLPAILTLTFRHPEHAPLTLDGWAERIGIDGWAVVAVRLEKGSRIEGTVRGPDGKPLVGAALHLLPAGVSPEHFSWEKRRVRTDAQGRYRMAGLADGDYVLRGMAEGLVLEEPLRFTVANQDRLTKELGLDAGRTVVGRIVDRNDRPVSGATIRQDTLDELRYVNKRFLTDADGRFQIPGLPLEQRAFHLWISALPLPQDETVEVRVLEATGRRLEIVIRTPVALAEPALAEEEQPVQVLIPSTTVRVEFPTDR